MIALFSLFSKVLSCKIFRILSWTSGFVGGPHWVFVTAVKDQHLTYLSRKKIINQIQPLLQKLKKKKTIQKKRVDAAAKMWNYSEKSPRGILSIVQFVWRDRYRKAHFYCILVCESQFEWIERGGEYPIDNIFMHDVEPRSVKHQLPIL